MNHSRPTCLGKRGQTSVALIIGLASLIAIILLMFMALRLRPDARRTSSDNVNIRVYCAAGIARPVEQLVNDFNNLMGSNVEIVRTGGSGELAGQVATEFHSGVERGADVVILADDLLLENGQKEKYIREIFPCRGTKTGDRHRRRQ